MKQIGLIALIAILSLTGFSQDHATLKITDVVINLNGEKLDYDQTFEKTLSATIPTEVAIYEADGIRYAVLFTYKKGENRFRLVRRAYAYKDGVEVDKGRQQKDMQETKTSISGSMKGRMSDNLVLNKEKMETIAVSFKYELIYK
jgi:hypothetical protein